MMLDILGYFLDVLGYLEYPIQPPSLKLMGQKGKIEKTRFVAKREMKSQIYCGPSWGGIPYALRQVINVRKEIQTKSRLLLYMQILT